MTSITNNLSLFRLINTTNYNNLSIQMKALLESQDFLEVFQEGFEKPESTQVTR